MRRPSERIAAVRFLLAECTEPVACSGNAIFARSGCAGLSCRQTIIPRDRVRRAVHEVANPLTIMRNYVNLLSDRLGAGFDGAA